MSHETLCLVWFVLLGGLLAGYAILDGFDLGVGMLHPFVARGDRERRVLLAAIGPLWDGNEVWLVTFGGAMFAMFPEAYASIFSGFYVLLMIALFALIVRAVSIEFRGKVASGAWRGLWDWSFFGASTVATLIFGSAVGNAMLGVPLDGQGNFTGGLVDQINPYALLVGLLALAMFVMHGAIFLYLKTDGDLQQRVRSWIWWMFAAFVILFAMTTVVTLLTVPRATANFRHAPWVWVVPALNVLAIANIPRALHLGRPRYAFVSSACSIAAFVFLLGVALYPQIVPARAGAGGGGSLSIFDAASSARTLTIGLIFVLVGMPFVLAYTALVYWTFRGKAEPGDDGY